MKNARRRDRALFLPSFGIPFRIFLMTGGNIEESIIRFFNGIWNLEFGICRGVCFGVFAFAHSRASSRSSLASPSSDSGMKDFVCVIFRGSASVGLKSSISDLSITIDANAVFSWRE